MIRALARQVRWCRQGDIRAAQEAHVLGEERLVSYHAYARSPSLKVLHRAFWV